MLAIKKHQHLSFAYTVIDLRQRLMLEVVFLLNFCRRRSRIGRRPVHPAQPFFAPRGRRKCGFLCLHVLSEIDQCF